MRNLPVALATLGQPALLHQASLRQAHITHHHPLSDAATLAFGDMLHALLAQAEPAHAMPACQRMADALVAQHPVFRYAPYPGRATGYVVDTVQTVLHHFSWPAILSRPWWARSMKAPTPTPPGPWWACWLVRCVVLRPCPGAGCSVWTGRSDWPSPNKPVPCWHWP